MQSSDVIHQDKQTLNFFCLLEITLGLWMIFPGLASPLIVDAVNNYLPIWLLGLLFVGGGAINFYFRYLYTYVGLVSMPLAFLGAIFFQIGLATSTLAPGTILLVSIGLYSSIFAGQVFEPNSLSKLKRG